MLFRSYIQVASNYSFTGLNVSYRELNSQVPLLSKKQTILW